RFGGSDYDAALAIRRSTTGDFIVGGAVGSNMMSFGDKTFPKHQGSHWDAYLAALDSNGTPQWASLFGGPEARASVDAIATDSLGNIFAVGYFSGQLDLGGDAFNSASSNYNDIFIAKFDASGSHVWSKATGGAFADAAYGVAVAPNGDVLITGTFETMDLGA